MADYPDHTTLTYIQGTLVILPIRIVAQTVTLEVDIVAQSVGDIAIDIAAQSVGNLDINLAASAITINVDLVAQTVGDITIDIEAQSVGVYLQPDWSALQDDDKNITGFELNKAAGSEHKIIDYTVPAGKTLYVTLIGGAMQSPDGYVDFYLYDEDDAAILALGGGAGGGCVPLTKPVKVPAGHDAELYVGHVGTGNKTLYAMIGGYEV